MTNKGNNQFEYFEQLVNNAAAINQGQVDALIKSSTTFTKGLEDIVKACMEIAQNSAGKGQEAAQELMSCKTIHEFADTQNKLAQSSFDEFITNSTKISEMGIKVCTESLSPINDSINEVVKQATKSMAA